MLLLLLDPLALLLDVIQEVVKHLESLDRAEVFLVVDDVFQIEDFNLSWRWKFDFLIEIAR